MSQNLMNEKPMTRKEATALYESGEWQTWSAYEKARRQINEPRLFMPISEFKAALSEVLQRPIFTHDLPSQELKDEVNALPPALSEGCQGCAGKEVCGG